MVRRGQGRKDTQKGRKNSSLKMLATQIDRERDLCTSSKFLQTYKIKALLLSHTELVEDGNHYITWPCRALFQPQTMLCTKILNQLKMLKKALIFCIRLDITILFLEILPRRFTQEKKPIPGEAWGHVGTLQGPQGGRRHTLLHAEGRAASSLLPSLKATQDWLTSICLH